MLEDDVHILDPIYKTVIGKLFLQRAETVAKKHKTRPIKVTLTGICTILHWRCKYDSGPSMKNHLKFLIRVREKNRISNLMEMALPARRWVWKL